MKCYVIIGMSGEYDEYHEWIHAVYLSHENADIELKNLEEIERAAAFTPKGKRRHYHQASYFEIQEHDIFA